VRCIPLDPVSLSFLSQLATGTAFLGCGVPRAARLLPGVRTPTSATRRRWQRPGVAIGSGFASQPCR